MLDLDVFKRQFLFDEQMEHYKESAHQKYYVGTIAKDGRKCLVKIKKSDPFEWSGHFMRDHREFLRHIRRIFDEWMTLLLSQVSYTLKVEGFTMDIVEIPSMSGTKLQIKSYIAMEKLDADLDRTYLKNNALLSTFEFQELSESIVELLAFYDNHGLFHGDINPANIMYRKGEFRLVPFGSGHLDSSHKIRVDKLTMSRVYCHPILEYQTDPTIGLDLLQLNDTFAAGLTLLQMGTMCPPKDIMIVKDAFNPHKPHEVKNEANKKLHHLMSIITHHYDDRFAHLIEGLLRVQRNGNIAELRGLLYGPNYSRPHHHKYHRHSGAPHLHHHHTTRGGDHYHLT